MHSRRIHSSYLLQTEILVRSPQPVTKSMVRNQSLISLYHGRKEKKLRAASVHEPEPVDEIYIQTTETERTTYKIEGGMLGDTRHEF